MINFTIFRMKISDFEKNIGIETYFTPYPGINGKLRTVTEDFIVNEIFSYPKQKEDGLFAIAEVSSKNWETHRLVKELSKKLRISRNRIHFAGTKDKRSYSSQLMSFRNVNKEDLLNLRLKDVTIENTYNSDKSVTIGKLLGNKFRIIVRDIDKRIKKENIENIFSYLSKNGGFSNFYGVQRFGITRPITHIVGKYLLKGDFEKAVMIYIANPISGESPESFNMRKELENTHDFSKAFHEYPDYLNFEKAMLNKLIHDPTDYVLAFKELPKNLQTMFINAYQSYLFNKILSKRILKKIPLNNAIVGDLIIPIRNGKIDHGYIPVKESNIDKVNKQISKQKAFISGLLVGNKPIFSEGEMGEIEHKVIEEEKIDYRDFVITEIPYISSSGSRRALIATFENLDWELKKDEINENKKALQLYFELQKGCYATSLLREIMKSDDVKNY